jgi:putative exporter of polyketide antibiotics
MKAIRSPAPFKRGHCASRATLSVSIKRVDNMHALTFWKRTPRQNEPDLEGTRSNVAGRQTRRRALLAVSLGGTVVAAIAITLGLPATGLAVYIAATLPFAIFP